MNNVMEITITIDGVTRKWKGNYDTLSANDWNEKLGTFIDDVHNYTK